jgi:hypothetical protein
MAKYIVTIDSTHCGFINRNNTWYVEDDMVKAVDSWVKPYRKPILRYHDKKSDPIGRVISAVYVPTKNNSKNPSGFIRLRAFLSDEEAAEKVKDGRYETVSISAEITVVRCSICNKDIVREGLCEHIRGRTYDGKKAFWYLGGLTYTECSFVNKPADVFAKVVNIEEAVVTEGFTVKNESKKENLMFTFADEEIENNEEDVEDSWEDFTDEDLEMAHWLAVELQNEFEDAKLSAGQRKKLKSKVFCGPSRSFPVNDCAHYTAALRLIGRYKGPGDKGRIRSCIMRRGKSLGCSGAKKKTKDEQIMSEMSVSELVESRQDLQDHIKAQVDSATRDMKAQLKAVDSLATENETLKADNETLKEEKKNLKENADQLTTDNENLKGKIHQNLVDKVYDAQKSLKKKSVMDLKDEDKITAYKATLAKRTDDSLTDALDDLQKEKPVADKKKITKSEPDSVEEDDEEASPSKPVSKQERAKNIIFKKVKTKED